MSQKTLDKKTFNIIVGAVGVIAVLVVVFGVLDVRLPSFSFSLGGEEQAEQGSGYPIQDDASFETLTQVYHVEPPQAPSLTFDIALPKQWTVDMVTNETSAAFSKQLIGDVATVRSPYIGIYRPELRVQTVTLRHDIEAAVWLEHYILTNSFIPQEKVTAVSLTRAEGAFTAIVDGTPMLVQAAVQINGQQAVMAFLEIPMIFKDAMGFMQKKAISTFKLAISEEKTVEVQKAFTLAEMIKFSYPASWDLAPPSLRDLDRVNVQLYNKNSTGLFQGYMQVFIVRRLPNTSLVQEAQRLREYLTSIVKLDIDSMEEQRPLPALNRYAFNRMEIYKASSTVNPNATPQELRLITLGGKDHYIFLMMLSPQASADIYNWGRNTRALDLVAASLQ